MDPRRFIGQQQVPANGIFPVGQIPIGQVQNVFPSQGVIPAGMMQVGVPQNLFNGGTNQPTPYFQQLMQEYQQMQQQLAQRGQGAQQNGQQQPIFVPNALQLALGNLGKSGVVGTGGMPISAGISGLPLTSNGGINNNLGITGRHVYAPNQPQTVQPSYPRVGGNTAPTANTVPSYRNVNVSSGKGVGDAYRNALQQQVNRLGDMSTGISQGISSF